MRVEAELADYSSPRLDDPIHCPVFPEQQSPPAAHVAYPSKRWFRIDSTNAPPPETMVKMDGPASLTKDWRSESSRIGRYHGVDGFKLKPNGTWAFEASDSNPFNSKLFN